MNIATTQPHDTASIPGAEDQKRPICTRCGGTEVAVDGACRWDDATASWKTVSVFDDKGHCDDCGGECVIGWKPVPAPLTGISTTSTTAG